MIAKSSGSYFASSAEGKLPFSVRAAPLGDSAMDVLEHSRERFESSPRALAAEFAGFEPGPVLEELDGDDIRIL